MSTHLLSTIIVLGITAGVAQARSAEPLEAPPGATLDASRDADSRQLSDSDRRRLEESGAVVVKHFVAGLRHGDERVDELRKMIDPRYLKKHRRANGELSFEKVVTGAIHDLQVSDDPATILCIATTDAAPREIFVFRMTVHEGSVYVLPLGAPDPATGAFKPWILRTRQAPDAKEEQSAGVWNVQFANGVAQVCSVSGDGAASVVEPARASAGRATVNDARLLIAYDDNRIERWTSVGQRRVVEHWFPASQFPEGTPVVGIAERLQ